MSEKKNETEKVENVVIVGSGPAGHTAGIYTGRADLSPLMYEGFMAGGVAAGGQLTTTNEIENFPGFPDPLTGQELMEKMKTQSIGSGLKIKTETVNSVDLTQRPFIVKTDSGEVKTKSLIIATGAIAKKLDIPGVDKYWQRGISACAVCDGALPIFRNNPLAVIGGGDTACEEAEFLTKFASKVYLIHRRDELRASKAMQHRVKNHSKIEIIWDTITKEVTGDGNILTGLVVQNVKTNEVRSIDVNGLFFAIGHKPNTDFLNGQINLDESGYIVTENGTTRTNIEGVFAAGDVKDRVYRQAITSAGSGCQAALEAERYLSSLE